MTKYALLAGGALALISSAANADQSSAYKQQARGGLRGILTRRPQRDHIHMACLRCGKVEEFFGEPLNKLRRQVEAHFGFEIILARTEIGGYCPNCQMAREQELREAAEV